MTKYRVFRGDSTTPITMLDTTMLDAREIGLATLTEEVEDEDD